MVPTCPLSGSLLSQGGPMTWQQPHPLILTYARSPGDERGHTPETEYLYQEMGQNPLLNPRLQRRPVAAGVSGSKTDDNVGFPHTCF